MTGAIVKGPCYLGRGTIVAMNALVRDANVGESCVIGFSTEVARSYLGSNVWTHSNYIGDSVIGNDVSFGAGAVVGNLRLDEGIISVAVDGAGGDGKVSTGTNKWGIVTGDHIRVGVNTSFMPGVRVGGESFIGAGIVVGKDVPKKSFVTGDWKLKVDENKGSFSEEMREMMRKKL
jgi:bifunctional UDP-N-acetylglucosamine pyrophosphorylase/glucosamine-1-phosphate N-acetyltransferase